MAVTLGHDHAAVPQYLLHLIKTAARVDQKAGERMAQVVHLVGPPPVPRPVRPRSPLALSEAEQSLVLQALCSERFCDTALAAVHATLLDEGSYLGSVRTRYR